MTQINKIDKTLNFLKFKEIEMPFDIVKKLEFKRISNSFI